MQSEETGMPPPQVIHPCILAGEMVTANGCMEDDLDSGKLDIGNHNEYTVFFTFSHSYHRNSMTHPPRLFNTKSTQIIYLFPLVCDESIRQSGSTKQSSDPRPVRKCSSLKLVLSLYTWLATKVHLCESQTYWFTWVIHIPL